MIFLSVIAVFLGLGMVALGFIVNSKAGVLAAGAAVAVYALLAGMRMAKGKYSRAALTVGAIFALLPVWLIPAFNGAEQYRTFVLRSLWRASA